MFWGHEMQDNIQVNKECDQIFFIAIQYDHTIQSIFGLLKMISKVKE